MLCNTEYPHELENLKRYNDFGGKEKIDLADKSVERFVHAAQMIKARDFADPVEHAFDILKNLERGGTQWSYVIDVVKWCCLFPYR